MIILMLMIMINMMSMFMLIIIRGRAGGGRRSAVFGTVGADRRRPRFDGLVWRFKRVAWLVAWSSLGDEEEASVEESCRELVVASELFLSMLE